MAITMVTPIEYPQTMTTVTMLVWPLSERFLLRVGGSLGSPAPPASQPKTQKRVAMTSTPKMAPTSWYDG